MPLVDVLLPTVNRLESLIAALAGVASQSLADMHLIVADQSDEPAERSPVVRSLLRVIEARGGSVEWHTRPQIHGIAEQRHFLLQRSRSPAVLFLDDDVFMEPWVADRLYAVLQEQGCGFVGAFPAGLSHRDDVRPQQQILEPWEDGVQPESVEPEGRGWERFHLHRAANVYHAVRGLPAGSHLIYKVAWIAACILYDRDKLLEIGGFSFWDRLPRWHSGEEVLVQNLLMRRWGGCAILPSGTYSTEVATTVLNQAGTVDGHALDLLPEMVARFAPASGTPAPACDDSV